MSNPYQPTTHLPGSRAKIRVLTRRAAAGLPLFHPQDARLPVDISQETSVSPTYENDKDVDFRRYLNKLDRIIHEDREPDPGK